MKGQWLWGRLCFLAMVGLIAPAIGDEDPGTIPGFEDTTVFNKVMEGEIVLEEVVSTKTEFKTIARAFFHHVAPDEYMALAVNHPKYPELFHEIKEGITLKVNEIKPVYDYRFHILYQTGPISMHLYPEGTQVLFPIDRATKEARIENVITNYKDTIKFSRQTTRLIPYQSGMLVHDVVHFMLQQQTSAAGLIKKQLKQFYTRYVRVFRTELEQD